MSKLRPEALRLARMIEHYNAGVGSQRIVEDYQQAAAELRRLHDENEALKAAQYECGFGAGCCYQAAKSEADEVLLRQALDALELRCGTNADERKELIPALRERLGETK